MKKLILHSAFLQKLEGSLKYNCWGSKLSLILFLLLTKSPLPHLQLQDNLDLFKSYGDALLNS